MGEIIYKLPKGVELSPDLRKQAECNAYLEIPLYGQSYYIPITKEIKKQFGLIERHGKITWTNFKAFKRLLKISQMIISSLYLQVRDVVCAGIEQNLDQELRDGFSKLFEQYLHNKIKTEVNLRIEHKNDKIN